MLPTEQPGRKFEQISSLAFQMAETNSDTAWKCNIVLEEMEKKTETSYTVSNERLIEAGPMIWTVLVTLNVMPQDDKEDKATSATH